MHYICFDCTKNIDFASAGRFLSLTGHPHPKRMLDTAVLLLGYSGECSIAQDNREYTLKKGSFQILFPHTTHYGTAPTSADQSHFWCHFYLPDGYFIREAEHPSQLENEGLCVLPEFSHLNDSEKYFILFSQMIDEAEKLNSAAKQSKIICNSYIKILLLSLSDYYMEQASKGVGKHASASKIKEWIHLHACDGISASSVATALGYNPDYLNQIVKSDTGMTLCAYINSIRLKEAKNLLLNSSKTVSEIAYSSGFSDEKYFMKLFRRTEGVTPTQFRNAFFRIHLNK